MPVELKGMERMHKQRVVHSPATRHSSQLHRCLYCVLLCFFIVCTKNQEEESRNEEAQMMSDRTRGEVAYRLY